MALAKGSDADVSDEALRALRGFDLTPKEKDDLTQLAENLAGPHRETARTIQNLIKKAIVDK